MQHLIDKLGGDISIHAPRTGSDMWRLSHCHSNTNFNPRSPHGERLLILSICTPPVVISIHAPRTGSDLQSITR